MAANISAAALALTLTACATEDAPDACALVATTKAGDQQGRLKQLMKTGLSASEAANVMQPYENMLRDYGDTFDKRGLCEALVTKDKAKSDEMICRTTHADLMRGLGRQATVETEDEICGNLPSARK